MLAMQAQPEVWGRRQPTREARPVDGPAAGAVVIGEVPALAHERRDLEEGVGRGCRGLSVIGGTQGCVRAAGPIEGGPSLWRMKVRCGGQPRSDVAGGSTAALLLNGWQGRPHGQAKGLACHLVQPAGMLTATPGASVLPPVHRPSRGRRECAASRLLRSSDCRAGAPVRAPRGGNGCPCSRHRAWWTLPAGGSSRLSWAPLRGHDQATAGRQCVNVRRLQ
jgi:hypothetical protein